MEGGLFLSHNPFKKWWKKQVKTADFTVDNSSNDSSSRPSSSNNSPYSSKGNAIEKSVGEAVKSTTDSSSQQASNNNPDQSISSVSSTPPSVIATFSVISTPRRGWRNLLICIRSLRPRQVVGVEMTKGNYWLEMTTKAKEAVALEEKILEKKVNKTLIHEEKLLQRKLRVIERSTKTLIPFFHKPHNFLMQTNRQYASWHLQPYAIATHYATLILVFSLAVFSVWTTFTQKTQAGVLGTTQTHESKLSVTEITIDKNPDKFYLQDETTKEYTRAYTVEETTDGTKIKTKSATDAGFQQLLVNGNDSTLYDGDKLVAQAQVKTEEKDKDGNWQPIAIKSETLNPKSETNSKDSNSNDKTTPVSFLNKATAEDSQTITKELKSTNIAKQESDKVTVDNTATLSNGEELKVAVEAGLAPSVIPAKAGIQGKTPDQAGGDTTLTPIQKQTFSLDNKDQTTKRLSWVVQLKDYDIKEDSSTVIPDASSLSSRPEGTASSVISTVVEKSSNSNSSNTNNQEISPTTALGRDDSASRKKTYNSTVIDCSDYTGPMTWVENKDTDTVTIYFDEAGTTEDIVIDPILTVTQPTNQISVTDGTRTWVFDTSVAGAPKYYYDTHIGGGADNLASTNTAVQGIGPIFEHSGVVSNVSNTLVENTATRVKIRTTGNYATKPTTIDNTYTIYPDGRAFLQYSAADTLNSMLEATTMHYLSANPETWNVDNTNLAFVQSDAANNNYPGLSVVPYTTSEFGGATGWATYSNSGGSDTAYIYKHAPSDATYTGNMAIDFSNYRATNATRDNLMNEYRNPATLANFVKGTQTGDGFAEGEGAYTVTADASGDAKFDLQPASYPRLKPVITIAGATRTEDSYQVQIGGVLKTKGIDYNLSKSDASTVDLQLLSTVSANTTFEVSNGGNNNVWTNGSADGKWSTAGNWSLGNVPLATDNVVFGSATANCSIDATAVANTLTIATGYTGTVTANAGLTISGDFSLEGGTFNTGSQTINIGGNWSRVGGTFTYGTSTVKMTNTAGVKTVTSGGQSFYNFTMDGVGGTTQFLDTFAAAGILTLTNGTLNTNNQMVDVWKLSSSGSGTRTLTLGSSIVTLTADDGSPWTFATSLHLTFNCNTSTITLSGSSPTFQGGAQVYNAVAFTGSGTPTIGASSNTFASLIRTGTSTATNSIIFSADQTIGTLTINGAAANQRLLVTSNTLGTPRTITAAAVVLSNVDFRDITFAGAMAGTATSSSIGDCGGNSGVNWSTTNFPTAATTQTWDGTANLWSSAHWTSRVPLPQDTVILAGTNTVTADMPRLGKDISFTGATPLTLSVDVTSYSSVNFSNAGTFTPASKGWTFEGRGAHTITSAGKSFDNVLIKSIGGSYTLQDNFTVLAYFYLYNGTFDANNYNVTFSIFTSISGVARTITMGSGTWTATGLFTTEWNLTGTALTLNANSSTIILSYAGNNAKTFAGGGLTYNNLSITDGGSGAVIFTGANTFNNVTIGAPKTVTFPSGVTTTINGTFTANGTSTNLITINASTPGSAATIAHAGNFGTSWNSIRDITSTGGTWAASFSTNVSGNTGITFPTFKRVANGGGNYSATTTWDGGVVPATTDDIYADASSDNLTVDVFSECRSVDFTGYTHALALSGNQLRISGVNGVVTNNRFASGMSVTGPYFLSFNAVDGATNNLYTNGVTIGSPVLFANVGGTGTGINNLRDNLTVSDVSFGIQIDKGILKTNNFSISTPKFTSSNSLTRTINLGSSAVTITGTGTSWDFTTTTLLTFNAGTSTITFTGASPIMQHGSKTYNNVVFNCAGTSTVGSGATFSNLTILGVASKTGGFAVGNITINNMLTITGQSDTNRLLTYSVSSLGDARTFTAANVSLSNVDFRDITFAGTMAVTSASSIGDCGGNSGVNWNTGGTQIKTVAAPQAWTNVNGGNWSLNTNWTSRVPLPQDDVSFPLAFGISKTVHADMPRLGKTIDFSGATYTTALTFTLDNNVTNYGGLNLTGISAFTGGNLTWYVESGDRTGTKYITSNGIAITGTLRIQSFGASVQLADAISINYALNIINGTFIDAGFSLLTKTVIDAGTAARGITKTGNWTISYNTGTIWSLTSAGMTWSDTAGSITLSDTGANAKTFAGGGLSYNNIIIAGGGSGAVIFTGANTFNNVTIGSPKTVTFPSGVTTTINGTFTANGTAQPTKIINGGTLNGNFETLGGGGADVFADWTEGTTGSSTFNDETNPANVHSGSHALRFDVDASNSIVSVTKSSATTIGRRYKVTAWMMGSAGGMPMVSLGNGGTEQYIANLTTSYAQYVGYFTATSTNFVIKRNSATSKSFWVDDVTLEESADVELNASTPWSAATLSKSSGTVFVDYAGITDITAAGGATWYAGPNTTLVSGDTGWTTLTTGLWDGGGGADTNWSTAANWYADTLPIATTDVYFSGTTTNATIDAGFSGTIKSLTLASGYTNTITSAKDLIVTNDVTLSGGTLSPVTFTISVGGNWSRVGGTFTAGTSTVKMTNTSGTKTVTSGGQSFYNFTMDGVGGTTQFLDTFATPAAGTLTLTHGTLNTNNQAVNIGYLFSDNTNTRTLTLGSSAVTFSGNTTAAGVCDFGPTNLTITANTSIFTFTGTGNTAHADFYSSTIKNYNGLSLVFNNIGPVFLSPGSGSTFANLTRTGTANKTDSFLSSQNFTITGTLTLTGNSATNRLLARSTTLGTPYVISAANVSLSNVDFRDITFAGTMAVTSALSIGDCGGNSGVNWNTTNFPTAAADQHWVQAAGGNWSTASNWTSRVPLPQDNVYFNNAFTASPQQTVTSDMPRIGKSIDWTGATGTPSWATATTITSYGSIKLISGMSISGAGVYYPEGRGSYTITSAGKSWGKTFYFQGYGTTYTLLDDFITVGGYIVRFAGGFTFDANDFNVTGYLYIYNNSIIYMGNGIWTGNSATFTVQSGATIYAEGSTINLANGTPFSGGGHAYNNMSILTGASAAVIADANTFNNVTIGSPKTVTFPSGVTTTINGTFTANGTSTNLVTINSDLGGAPATISHASAFATSWNSIKDITSTGTGASWNASFSTSVSGNTGITFPTYKRVANGGGNFEDGTTWDGGVAPSATDTIYADASSGQLTINSTSNRAVAAFDFTGYINTLTLNVTFVIEGISSASVDCRFGSGMHFVGPNSIYFQNASASTVINLYTQGVTVGVSLVGSSTQTVNLRDALTLDTGLRLDITAGTFNTNNFAISVGKFSSSNSNARTINLGSSAITVTGTSVAWDFTTSTNLTFNAGTSNIIFTGTNVGMMPGGKIYNNVTFQGGGAAYCAGSSNTFANLIITGTVVKTNKTDFSSGTTQTINGTLTINGNSITNRMLITSGTNIGTAAIFNAAAVVLSNTDFRDITFAGTMAVTSASSIGDCGGNSGTNWASIVTPAAPQAWTNVNGGNWSDVANWSSRVPLPQDDVSLGIAFGASKIVHANMPRLGKTIDWSGATYTTQLRFQMDNNVTNYGGLNLTGVGQVISGYNWYFESNDRTGTKYITSNGKSFANGCYIQAFGSTVQLADAFSNDMAMAVYNGTFRDAGFSVTLGLPFYSDNTGTRAVYKTGNWTLNRASGSVWSVSVITGLTWSDTAGSITVSDTGSGAKSFNGGGLTYHDLNITGGGSGAVIFTGANTFNNVTIGSLKTVTFPSGVTTTINGTFTANGTVQPTKIITGGTLNGNLETWTSNTNAASWTESIAGTSTVNKETDLANVHSGSYAARLDVDASGSNVYIYQQNLTAGKRYKATFYAKVSASGSLKMYDGFHDILIQTLTTSYAQYTAYFTAQDANFRIGRSSASSNSIYIDDVTLEESADVELNASTPGSAATLSKATGIVALNYAGVKDTTVTGGAKWYLSGSSTDISGNTGWIYDNTLPTNPTTTTANVVNGTTTPITTGTWINQAGTINYSFSGATDPDSGLAGYYTYFGTNAAADPVTWQANIADPQTYSTATTTADDGKHFYFRVKTKDAVGNVGTATTLFDFGYDITLPTRPTFVAATPAGYTTDNSYTFSWPVAADPASANGASGIKWYEYKRATDVSWSHTADATTRTVSGIESYQQGPNAFYVRTVDNAGNISPTYQQVTYYFSGVVPNIPTALNVDPTISDSNEFTISWDKSTVGEGDPPVVGYYYSINAAPTLDNVTYVASQADHISIGHSPFATKQGENTVYVLAVNSIGGLSYEEDHVAHAHFTCQTSALPAPVNVALSDSSNRLYNTWSLTVKWQDELAQADPTFHHYSVERSTNGTDFTALPMSNTTIDPNVPAPEPSTAIIDIGLDNSILYFYRVKAVDNAGKESAPSSIVSKMPTGKYLTPPAILSAPTVSDIKSTSAKIAWMTDRSSSSIVRYSQNNPATSGGVFESSFGQYDSVTTHTVPLPTLNPSTTYYYQVQSIDELKEYDSNSAFSQTYTFTTAQAPAISATTVSNITLSTADITFDTTTVSTATISYGLIQDVYGTDIADISGASTTKHTVKLTGLSAGTVYNFRIKGTDIEGNILASDNYSFETLPLPQVEDLKIEAIPGRPRSAFKASWRTNVPTSTILRYSTDGTDWQETVKAKNEKIHSVEISGLEDDVAYSIIASGRDEIGNLTTSPTQHFTTPYDTRPPEITELNIETSMVGTGTGTKAQVTVGWKTDEVAIGKIEYGTGTDGSYTDSTTENSGLSMEKSTIISNLDPSRPYHLKVIVTDKAGNKTESDNQVFITNEVRRSAWDLIKSALNNIFGFWFAQYK